MTLALLLPRRCATDRAAVLIAAGLSIYKPRGRTPYGMRFAASAEEAERAPGWMTAFKIAVGLLLAFVIVKHLAGGGMGNHGP